MSDAFSITMLLSITSAVCQLL
jgi:hypothetical protein